MRVLMKGINHEEVYCSRKNSEQQGGEITLPHPEALYSSYNPATCQQQPFIFVKEHAVLFIHLNCTVVERL